MMIGIFVAALVFLPAEPGRPTRRASVGCTQNRQKQHLPSKIEPVGLTAGWTVKSTPLLNRGGPDWNQRSEKPLRDDWPQRAIRHVGEDHHLGAVGGRRAGAYVERRNWYRCSRAVHFPRYRPFVMHHRLLPGAAEKSNASLPPQHCARCRRRWSLSGRCGKATTALAGRQGRALASS